MAITITDRALQEFTDYWQESPNKYIRLYSRTLVFEDSVTISGNDVGTVIPILSFDVLSVGTQLPYHKLEGDNQIITRDFCYYNADTRTGKSVSYSGQTSSSDNQQQIGSLDLYLTWSDDDHSFIENSTVNYDEIKDTLTIDVTP
jgi:hypothetical protein